MKLVSNEVLLQCSGGAFRITAAMATAIIRGINTLLDFGRTIGTSLRMLFSKRVC